MYADLDDTLMTLACGACCDHMADGGLMSWSYCFIAAIIYDEK